MLNRRHIPDRRNPNEVELLTLDGPLNLACPYCGEDHLYLWEITVEPDDGHISISFWCECCHARPELSITERNNACGIAWGVP
jgi:hypothetical protein